MENVPDIGGPVDPYNPDDNSTDDTPNSDTSGGLPSKENLEKVIPVTLGKSPGTLGRSGSLTNQSWEEYTIKLKVILYHNGEKHDLTPYVLQIKTSMQLGQPSGRFALLLSFQMRWDLYVQPQDYVEIYFGRYSDPPPIIMRGLVSNVRRTRIVDQSGKVHRAITINGQNFGKIWENYTIQYLVQEPGQTLAGTDVDQAVGNLMAAMLTENYGIGNTKDLTISNADLMQGIVDKMLNPQLKALQQVIPQIPLLQTSIKVLSDYQIPNMQIQSQQGNVWSLLEQFGNKPWCEWFIDDFDDGPIVIYRNTPFKKKGGTLALSESLPDWRYFKHLYISDADIIEEDVGKTDSEAFSYFFTYPTQQANMQDDPKARIIGFQPLSIEQESDTTNITNPHVDFNNLYRYGFKDIQIASNSIPIGSDTSYIQQSLKMNQWLVNCFSWTQDMLNGTIRMKGNENMRIGRYFTNTSTKEEYYIESVDHEVTISQIESLGNDGMYSFQTTVGVTRGRRIV
jgi:hypothetical protein